MERSEWSDDDALESGSYPPAPLPPHERAWRHPSELGTATWTHTEPPLTLGRGLLITTGAIGGLLSLAVLWAMLPSAGRGGLVSPTVVSSSGNDLTDLISTARADTLVASSVVARTTATVLTVPASAPSSLPETTTAAEPPARLGTEGADVMQMPVAVGVGDSMVITTAHAAEGRGFVTVAGADGQPHDLGVLMVDRELGLAVLSPDAAATTRSYGIGPAVAAGDVVTVLSALPISANVRVDDDGHLTLDTWADSIPEGTPIVDADGLLVGMCSHGASGPVIVSVANVAAMLPGHNKQSPAGPWLGVHVLDSGAGPMIDGIDTNGPSAAAGMAIGDTITAVDGVSIGSVDDLKDAISGYVPTDVITVTVTHADQTSTQLTVTLGTAPSM